MPDIMKALEGLLNEEFKKYVDDKMSELKDVLDKIEEEGKGMTEKAREEIEKEAAQYMESLARSVKNLSANIKEQSQKFIKDSEKLNKDSEKLNNELKKTSSQAEKRFEKLEKQMQKSINDLQIKFTVVDQESKKRVSIEELKNEIERMEINFDTIFDGYEEIINSYAKIDDSKISDKTVLSSKETVKRIEEARQPHYYGGGGVSESKVRKIIAESGGGDGANDSVKVSSNDTTAGYLNGKIVAGNNIVLTENNDGSNETLTVSADLTSLQTQIDGKADAVHTHTKADITDFDDADYATAAQGSLADTAIQPSDNVSSLTNDAGYQTASDVSTAINGVIDAAPGTLDTLNELAAALGDDPNFATTVTNQLANKSDIGHTHTLSDVTDSGALAALDTVDTAQIENGAITGSKIANGAIGYSNLSGSVQSSLDAADSALQAESDTLQSVTQRGATTDQAVEINNDLTVNGNTLTVNSVNGRVGVGVFNPQESLHVADNARFSADTGDVIYGASSSGTTIWELARENTSQNGDMSLKSFAGWDFFVNGRAYQAMTINSNGYIGIGTPSPTAKLDVNGDTNIDGDLTVDTDTFHVDSVNNKVGIGTASPETTLSVNGVTSRSYGNMITYKDLTNYSGGSNVTGTMKITMAKGWSNTMGVTTIKGYNYNSLGAWEVVVSGYNYGPSTTWINTSVEVRGSTPFNTVRLAYDGSKNVILLGDTSTSWSLPKIEVSEFRAGYSQITGWGSGWSIAPITSETGITNVVAPVISYSGAWNRNGNYIYYNNNVGIGTTSPSEKLEVNGKIKATNINFSGLPTSSSGLSTGDVWNDGGTLKIV